RCRHAGLDGGDGHARSRGRAQRRSHRVPARRSHRRRDPDPRRRRTGSDRTLPERLNREVRPAVFALLGTVVSPYPRWVLLAWLLAITAALPFAARVGDVLTGQPDAPQEGEAAAVRQVLSTSFAQAEEETMVAIAYGEGVTAGTTAFDDAVGRAVE